MDISKQKLAAKEFASKWAGDGSERGGAQSFWIELLEKVLGVENAVGTIIFEKPVKKVGFADGYIPSTKVLIEQKKPTVNLDKAERQSDGAMLTPYEQARRYDNESEYNERARWIVVCNFREFRIYDMMHHRETPQVIYLKDLPTEYYRLEFLINDQDSHVAKEMEVSLKAGEIIGELYDEIRKQYVEESEETFKSLNVLCTRLVFCLYAEDAGIFGRHSMFHDYLSKFKPGEGEMREALLKLFEVLNTPVERRSPYLRKDLAEFPYVNGGLFADNSYEVPFFTEKVARLLLTNASNDFDWSQISPTIFGAVFESTLNPDTRRSGGMHYTSIENIHKVIDPLFLNDLQEELIAIQNIKVQRTQKEQARAFQDKLASLRFLDPACGSGNFLTETFVSLRRLENQALRIILGEDQSISLGGDFSPIKVDIHQMYGIEINDFAVSVAKTALWIAESQMMDETSQIVQASLDFLPLKSYDNIKEGNALRIDWNDVIPASEVNYIMGNPPFVGARMMNKEQKDDAFEIFGRKWKNVGNLDYVGCWYKKAADYIQSTAVRCALVSTNSITQGEQVADLWKSLMENSGVHIDFAYRTFRWDSESSLQAHVHCVIVGFSVAPNDKPKRIYDGEVITTVRNINGYLIDADNVFIESRSTPLSNVPTIGIGNKPIDGGNYLFKKDEMEEFIKREPQSEKYFHPFYGAEEFINNKIRYCLWLGECSPAELRGMPCCLERVQAVRMFRLASSSIPTQKLADVPTRFHVENMPETNYLLVPRVSSERRRYVPIGFMSPDNLTSDSVQIIPDATLYHFGVLTSNVHMAWMRAVCGRLKSDYRYSKDIVYNNFPWPNPTEEQKAKIESTAQGILDARALYPDSSLADLYDERTMPIELRRAHQANDRAVMAAYGFPKEHSEPAIVADLLTLYQKLLGGRKCKAGFSPT